MRPFRSQNIKPEHYQRWLEQPASQRLLALEAGWLANWVKRLYGVHLVYAGIDPNPKFLIQARTAYQFELGLPWAHGIKPCQAQMADDAWPFADESLDVVILQHSLDLSAQPQQLIKEASRCLVANGYLIIVGFNPYSGWGLWRWLRTFSSELPWITHPVALGRLHDWLTILDLRVEHSLNGGHLWPFGVFSEPVNRRVDRVLAGNSWLPASIYMLMARKTVAGVTPIRMRKMVFKRDNFGAAAAARLIDPYQ